MTTNDKREQARILREIGEGWKANGITTGVDACLNGAAALMREAEADTAPDVSEAELASILAPMHFTLLSRYRFFINRIIR